MNRDRSSWASRLRSGRARSTALLITVLVGLTTVAGRGQQAAPFRGSLRRKRRCRPSTAGCAVRIHHENRATDEATRIKTDRSDQPAYLSGSVIVKYADHASFDIENIPLTAGRRGRRCSASFAAGCRIRAAALPEPRHASPSERSHVQQSVEPDGDRHGTRVGHSTRRDLRTSSSPSSTPAWPFSSDTIRYTARFPFRVTTGGPIYPALGTVDVPFAAAPELGASGSSRFVAPHDFIWDDNLPVDLDGHGTHVSGTIGQLTNNSIGVAGMAYNVRIMPVKVIAEHVGRHLRQSQWRHR